MDASKGWVSRARAITVSLLFFGMLLMSVARLSPDTSAGANSFISIPSLDGYIQKSYSIYNATTWYTTIMDSNLVGGETFYFVPGGHSTDYTYRSFLSFDTSSIPSGDRILSLKISFYLMSKQFDSGASASLRLFTSSYTSLDTGDWNNQGSFLGTIVTESSPIGNWYSLDISASWLNLTGNMMLSLRSDTQGTYENSSWTLGDGASPYPPTLSVQYASGGTIIDMQLSSGWLNSTAFPEVQDWNATYDLYSFSIDTVPNIWNITIMKSDSSWIFQGETPACAVTDTPNYTMLQGVYASTTYRAWFTVPKTNPFCTVHLSLFNSFTGEGYFWEQMKAEICDGSSWNDSTAQALVKPDFIVNLNASYTIRVLDYFDNVLTTYSFVSSSQDIYLQVGVPYYSWQIFNQNDEPVLMRIFWNNSGSPWEFFVAPHWVQEQLLKGGTYTFEVTFYDSNGTVGQTVYYYRTIPMQGLNASFLFINGTTLSEIVSSVQGMQSSQQIITSLLTPSTVVIYDNLPLAPIKVRTLTVDNGLKLDPFLILQATTYQNGTGTSIALWSPHPTLVGATYYIDSDTLAFSGNYQSHVWVNATDGSSILNETILPATLNLQGQNVTVQSNQSIAVSRTTTWREISAYTVTFYASLHEYKATLTLNDTTSMDYYNPYWFISFPTNATIDQSSVTVNDVNNALTLTNGDNFEVTAGGVHMTLSRLNASQSRTFTFTFWDLNGTNGIGAPNLIAQSYTTGTLNGNSMLYTAVQWMNPWSTAYSGEMYVTLNFTGGDQLVLPSITVVDQSTNRQLPVNDWVYTGRTVIILTDGVGTVGVGQGKNFGIYFTLSSSTTQKKTDFFFGPIVYNGMLLYIGSVPLSWALVFLAVGWAAAIVPSVEPKLRRRYGDGTQMRVILMVCITVIVAAAAGVLA